MPWLLPVMSASLSAGMKLETSFFLMEVSMDIEFFEPAEAAALMRCTESWLRDGATSGRFPHACWGKGKIIFTSEHILEIAKLSEILPGSTGTPLSAGHRPAAKERLIGSRAKVRLAPAN
ncbi:hypothetical protein C9424_14165 [Arthrobacter sp. H-02-3]|nr:hypothetical protein C9424_14165 [Arthrobacter sp. H-02-3]